MSKRKRSGPSSSQLNTSGVNPSNSGNKRRISLEEVAAKTKISMRFLRAIESEDFGELPGGIFVVNYLRQYAEAVGMDAQELLERYRKKMHREPIEPEESRSPHPGRTFLERLFRIPATKAPGLP
jgi:cytoskeletal protein RodZ